MVPLFQGASLTTRGGLCFLLRMVRVRLTSLFLVAMEVPELKLTEKKQSLMWGPEILYSMLRSAAIYPAHFPQLFIPSLQDTILLRVMAGNSATFGCFYLSKLRSIILQQYFWFTQDRDHVQVSFFHNTCFLTSNIVTI